MPYRPPGRRGRTPQDRGRFDGFDAMAQAEHWDDVTAGAVLDRLAPSGDLAFFTDVELAIAAALTDLLLAQDAEPRVPVVQLIDVRLAMGETDGWHYDELPEDSEAWRQTLAALDEDARATNDGRSFTDLAASDQAGVVQAVQDRATGGERWHQWPAKHIWSLWTRYACTAFYSHPWAWNEIGFPGPAYPRGYLNLGVGARERWETPDRRDVDPVPFAARAERARREHHELVHGDDR